MPPPNDETLQFSVVVPCFNSERYLAHALDSILAQRQPSLEIICVDDGSTDGSAAIAARYSPTLRLLQQGNAGIGAARNAGVMAARGAYLAFLDSDDLWPAESLAKRHRMLSATPSPSCVFGALEQFYSEDQSLEARRRMQASGDTPSVARFAGTMLIRRADFLRVGGFDTAFVVGEMIEWVARAEANGLHLHTLDALVLRRRLHGENTTLRHAAELRHSYLRALKSGLESRRAAVCQDLARSRI